MEFSGSSCASPGGKKRNCRRFGTKSFARVWLAEHGTAAPQDHASLRFWIAARNTEQYGYFRKRFWTAICSRRTVLHSLPQFQRIWHPPLKNWDLILQELQGDESEMRRESRHSSISVPRFQSGGGLLNHTGGTYSYCGVIYHPRFAISELHLGKFPHSMEFQSRKVNFQTEVRSKSAVPHLTMHWIKEVEIAKSKWRT